MLERLDFCAALVAILLLHLKELVLHHLLAQFRVVENLLQVGNLTLKLLILGMELVHTQTCELGKTHVDNSLRLNLVELETLLQVALGVARSLGGTYDVHHLVDVVAGDDQTLEYVGTLLRLLEVELGAADGYVVTMLHEVLHAFLKSEQTWASLYQGDAVDRERRLHGCHFVELVEDYVGVGVTLHVHHDTHTLSARLVVDVGDARNLAFLHEVGYACHEVGLVHSVRYLCDDNLVVGIAALNLRLGAHHDSAAASLVGLLHSGESVDIGACWEIGSLDVLHESVDVDVGIVDIGAASVNHLAKVVCRNVCSHTHGNTVATIHKEVWNLCRHNRRLKESVVEVGVHVYSILFEVVHDVLAHLRESALGITHGSWRVAVHRAEVALSVHKHIAHVPALAHTHKSSIYRRVAMRMILTKNLTYDTCTFLVGIRACVSNAKHTVEYAAVNGLESVTYIRQGSGHNHRHTVVDVRGFHFFLNVDFQNPVLINCLIFVHFILLSIT